MLKLVIEIPALDRLIDYLENKNTEAVVAEIIKLTAKLATSEATLKGSIHG